MKKLALILFTVALVLRGANVQIELLPTTAVLPFSDDYGIQSGATRGTAKFAMAQLTYVTATRATLAALSITGVADGIGISVLGATSVGDGGASLYVWSATSTATPNGNTVILPSSAPGTGRWLKALGGVGAPGVSTLGGVFSNVGSSHNWIKSINTDGTVTLAQPVVGDISGIGGAASLNVGTGAGTVAAGDDSRITGAAQKSANLSDLASASTSRTNLGLGTAATSNTTAFDAAGAATAAQAAAIAASAQRASNLSDLASASTSRTNLGLGTMATQNANAVSISGGTLAGVTITSATLSVANVTAASGSSSAAATFSASGSTAVETIMDTGGSGAGISFTNVSGAGGGATRTIRARAGYLDLLSSAGAAVGQLDDSGNMKITGAFQPVGVVNAKFFGAKGDGKVIASSSVSIASGSATLVVGGAGFASGDVGKAITVKGAGPAGVPLVTTIAAFVNSGQVTLSATASTTLTFVAQTVPYGTDDTNAINAAVAALPAKNAILYFPAGIYFCNGAGSNVTISAFGNISGLQVMGDGPSVSRIYNGITSVGGGANTFVCLNTCSGVQFSNLWADGLVTSRQQGIHFRIQCPNSGINNCWISGSSGFGAFFDDTTTTVTNAFFTNNFVFNTGGDGVHLSNVNGFIVSHDIFSQCGDDAIAPLGASPGTNPCQNGVVSDCEIFGRTVAIAGASTDGHRGVAIQYARNIEVSNLWIYNTKSTAVEVADDSNSSFYCQRIHLDSVHAYNCVQSPGPYASIEFYFVKDCTIKNCTVTDPANASCYAVTDFSNVDFAHNTGEMTLNQFCRGLVNDAGTSYSGRAFAANWFNLTVSDNTFDFPQASSNESIYLPIPGPTCKLNNVIIDGNRAFTNPGTWIAANWLVNAKAVNNTAIPTSGTATVGLGGNSTGTFTANNN